MKTMSPLTRAIFGASLLAIATTAPAADRALTYPVTAKVPVTDDYFGTKVVDPYRWLESDVRTSDSVSHWVEAEDGVTRAYLASLPGRDAIEARLKALWNYERTTAPVRRAGHYFFTHNDGLQNQSVLVTQEGATGTPRVLFDPNTLSADGTVALAGWTPSEDGKWLGWGVSMGGTDWQEWRVRNVETGKDSPETIRWLRYSGIDWAADNSGFYYSRYDEPKEGTAFTGRNLFQKVYFHVIGTDQSADHLVYQRKDQPEWLIGASTSEDGKWLVFDMNSGGEKNRIYVQDLKKGGDPVPVIDEFTAAYNWIGNDGNLFYFRTDDGADRGRVIAIDVTNPARNAWKTIVPEGKDALRGASLVGNSLVLTYLRDASSAVEVRDLNGALVRTLELPAIGTASGFTGRRSDSDCYYTFSSFTVPPTIYHLDPATGASDVWKETKVDFNPADFEVTRQFITSKDGTKVPLFLAHKKGMPRNGALPTLLYVYGGFNQPQLPTFSVTRLGWMEMGGVFALVCARGGGEYGREWHEAAIKNNKQKTFDDVIAAGEWLVAQHVTIPSHLGLQGGSNGGMVVGAVTNQRPDLFGAVLVQAGVMDMLRYQKFTIGKAWSGDYGLSDKADEFPALYAYSPYQNVKPGTKYPAILVTTSDFDDRVVPGHSFKYAAALQAAQAGPAPVVIRISRSTGHNGGMKPTTMAIAETADLWSFLAANLGMKVAG